jgi:hypothetical protein
MVTSAITGVVNTASSAVVASSLFIVLNFLLGGYIAASIAAYLIVILSCLQKGVCTRIAWRKHNKDIYSNNITKAR